MQILKIVALLIEYPDETLWESRDEALSLIAQDAPVLLPFARQHLGAVLLDKQAEWCEIFDRGRATSLLLFEHVHAESRDRGQAMGVQEAQGVGPDLRGRVEVVAQEIGRAHV